MPRSKNAGTYPEDMWTIVRRLDERHKQVVLLNDMSSVPAKFRLEMRNGKEANYWRLYFVAFKAAIMATARDEKVSPVLREECRDLLETATSIAVRCDASLAIKKPRAANWLEVMDTRYNKEEGNTPFGQVAAQLDSSMDELELMRSDDGPEEELEEDKEAHDELPAYLRDVIDK